jgi:hypothetical protein
VDELYLPHRRSLGPGHRALGRALTVLLASCVGLSVLKVVLDLYGLSLSNRWETNPENIVVADGRNYDLLDLGLLGLQLLVMLATRVVTVTWLSQAYGSREADPALLPFKRWWTIGGWLIPVICCSGRFSSCGTFTGRRPALSHRIVPMRGWSAPRGSGGGGASG